MRYPVVLFDAGETLFGPREPFGAVYARVLGPMGIDRPAEALEDGIRRSWRELERRIPRGKDRYSFFPGGENAYWLRFVRGAIEHAQGAPPPEGVAERALGPLREAFRKPEAWRVFPDTFPALDALASAGVRLAVVSNWDSRLPFLLDALGLAERFEVVVVSHFVGVEKPDSAIFRHALDLLDASPGEALHVGDLPEIDLEGARAAGIDGVLVDRRGKLPPGPGVIPDLTKLLD